jgi:1,4-alpha-glucan branching enzyme
MVKTQRASRKGFVKVAFSLPHVEAATLHVMGDFNDWRPVHAMRRTDDGEWQLSLELEHGREYQFKYLLDETVWINDPHVEKSVANPYGGENSVVAT